MKIYTRSGDQGKTALFSGERVEKDHLRVEAYGTLDELNSVLGLAASFCRSPRVLKHLQQLQNKLFNAGADMATAAGSRRAIERIGQSDWQRLEQAIDELEVGLPRLKNFILPAGSQGASCLHLARSVCRRAERLLVQLMKHEEMNPELLIFLNRLSDFLFVLARCENIEGGQEEVIWTG